MLVDFGKANLLQKARQQPDKVRMVLDKVRTDGLIPTIHAVRNKLEQPLPMGYSNVGRVLEVGAGVEGFSIGERVVSNGKHAEIVCVSRNLCARIPESVSDEAASFTVVSAIALQGIRLVAPSLGESMVVTGLGLIGLITVQLLRAHGCRVLGVDFDPDKLALAREFGAETVDLSSGQDPVHAAARFSRGRGVDGVIITASTKSNEPVHQAANMCRKRGRIVLVGVAGLELSRADFYEKELTFQVSCSYGPGRYDAAYEEQGQDYPFGFVRWTEQRNFEAVLDMMAEGRLDVTRLISHRFPLEQAAEAYKLLSDHKPCLGIVLDYGTEKTPRATGSAHAVQINLSAPVLAGRAVIGIVGSGNYASQVLIPAFKNTHARLKVVVSAQGVSGVFVARRNGIEEASSRTDVLFADSEVNTVVIATRHDLHAGQVISALRAGKHVFVEKPLVLNLNELHLVKKTYDELIRSNKRPLLMVGFNRRFAPQVVKIKSLLQGIRAPKSFIMTVNAGHIPAEHWTQDRAIGGGRIIGEGCHFIDLLRHLAGVRISGFKAHCLGGGSPGVEDKATILLEFEDGSTGAIHYLANGHKSFPKERLEVFCEGAILQLDNFRGLRGFGWKGFSRMNLWRQDKGQAECVRRFVAAIEGGLDSPIPYDQLVEVAEITIAVDSALRERR
jgi:predicted dehydrogenase/threonine dehydrogenase-like Zn-dependent dehydrogenase